MATSDYQSSAKLKAIEWGGMIHEDVMNKIFTLDPIPLPYTDAVGSGTADNEYTEWTERKLPVPTVGGWRVDGADTDKNEVTNGERLGNNCGIQDQEVQVTGRAQASGTIGYGNELAEQVRLAGQKIRRNVEANLLGNQGSQADNGDATPGIPAGLAAMLTQYDVGSGATGGGFASGSWTGITAGTAQALKYSDITGALEAAFLDNAAPSMLMTVPTLIAKLSDYMFTSGAPIATLQSNDADSVNPGGAATAVAAVNVLISNFGQTVTFVPNRLQQTYKDVSTTDDAAAVFLLDPSYCEISYLRGYRTSELAKAGDTDKRQMLVDFTQKTLNRDAGRVLLDLDPTAAVVD